jgi:GDP-L-fucose synthase
VSIAVTFPLMRRKIWVTGAHGFLGRHLVEQLELQGCGILAPTMEECNLLDPQAAANYIAEHRPDGVIHLAALVGGIGANRKHPGSFFYANMAMGLHLIESCRRAGVEKILILGTVCAYPKFTQVPFREEDLWDGYPEETNAPYGIAKKALLVQLQSYRQEYGTRGIFLLPVNLYGPGDSLNIEDNHVIPAMFRKFLEAARLHAPSVELWGTGGASREFLYVKDAAQAIVQAMLKYEDGEPVNLGTGREILIRDLAFKIKEITGYNGEIVFNPAFPDGQPKRQLDTSRAESRFGWRATTSLDEGLGQTLKWMKDALASVPH